ncbi:MAG: hypothetical protein SW833_09065 [Cyanobacteriota bacterium]|nr:hypothetical protein [Cyanobacteriota bacterium]
MTHLKKANLKTIFGLDLRSLAVFRIGLALAVIAEVVTRSRALEAHYTDSGVLPRTVLIDQLLRPWYWSIHLISGQPAVQAFLFLLAIGLAICLLVGYHTRLVTIATWALIISVQNRNPVLSFAGDHVLRAVLFWAMFLPLGACYSIDSALNSSSQPLPKRIFSGATIAFIIQLCFIYIWSAAFKTKSDLWWPTGDAVYYSLSYDQYTTHFGQFLLSFPNSFLRVLTFAALGFEWVGPLLLFIPFYNNFLRIIAIVSFVLLHIGFELCFDIGVLSYLSIVNWLCLIPSIVWDTAARNLETSARQGLKIYYDADCGFCKKVVHFIRTFLILPGTPLLKAQDDAEIYAAMEEQNSWVVRDYRGINHYKFEGIVYVFSLSPILGFIAPLLRSSFVRSAGTKMYETIASNRQKAGLLTRPFKFRPIEVKPSRILDTVALFFLLIAFMWNLKGFADQTVVRRRNQPREDWASQVHRLFKRRTVQRLYWLPELTRLDQVWSIFAPSPPLDDGWYAIVGQLKDGSEVNVLQEDQPIPWNKPTVRQRKALYKTIQWRVYYIEMNRAIGQKLYPYLGQYLCRTWNAEHSGKKQLVSLKVYFMDERTVPPDEKQTVKKSMVWQQSCSD